LSLSVEVLTEEGCEFEFEFEFEFVFEFEFEFVFVFEFEFVFVFARRSVNGEGLSVVSF